MIDDDNLRHLAEASLAGLAALGAWVWRLARIDQRREDRLARIEQWREAHMREYRELAATLTLLQQGQAVQTAELRNICRSLDELRNDQREIIASRMAGGRRSYDPPAGGTP